MNALEFDPRLVSYFAISTLLIVTPGPDTALVVRNALRWGWRGGSLTTIGIASGSLAWAAASLLGVAVLIQASHTAFNTLKFTGAAYLVFLGIRGLMRRTDSTALETAGASGSAGAASIRAAFWQAALNNLLNPKAAIIFVSVMPQFIEPHSRRRRSVLPDSTRLLAREAMLAPGERTPLWGWGTDGRQPSRGCQRG